MKNLFVFFTLFFHFILFAEGQITFQMMYGDTNNENEGSLAIQTSDGGYIISGSTYYFSNANVDSYIIKVNHEGLPIWSKTFGNSTQEYPMAAMETANGDFIVVGQGYYNPEKCIIFKIDNSGNFLWNKVYSGFGNLRVKNCKQASNEGYIIVGNADDSGVDSGSVFVFRTDSVGDTLWTKSYGGNGIDLGSCITQTYDGGFILLGSTTSFGFGNSDIFLIKTDSLGDTLWTRTYGGPNNEFGRCLQQTPDSGFILASIMSDGIGGNNVVLIKTNSLGDTLWTKVFFSGNFTNASYCSLCNDGNYLIAGDDMRNYFLIKIDLNGDTIFTRKYGWNGFANCSSVFNTNASGFILSGTASNSGAVSHNIYVVKTDDYGLSGCNDINSSFSVARPAIYIGHTTMIVHSPNFALNYLTYSTSLGGPFVALCNSDDIKDSPIVSLVRIFPNPTLALSTISSQSQIISVEIVNLLGEKIYSSPAICRRLWTVNCGLFPVGIYFVKVETENGTSVQKLIKQ